MQANIPQKLKDPESYIIDYRIGNSTYNKALCDFGASINLMPLSVFEKLGLRNLKPTSMNLQLVDRSLSYPKGIVEDVLVKVDKFKLHADFVIMEMEKYSDIAIILRRPFVATGKAKARSFVLIMNTQNVLEKSSMIDRKYLPPSGPLNVFFFLFYLY